jgi:hypothetical protein
MTVCYQMSVSIDGHRPDRAKAIKEAAEAQWLFDAWDDHGDSLWSSGFEDLGGGATAAEFAEDLAEVVWEANEAYCEVPVGAICMDYPEEYSFDERSYRRYKRVSEGSGRTPETTGTGHGGATCDRIRSLVFDGGAAEWTGLMVQELAAWHSPFRLKLYGDYSVYGGIVTATPGDIGSRVEWDKVPPGDKQFLGDLERFVGRAFRKSVQVGIIVRPIRLDEVEDEHLGEEDGDAL